jgi:hypothetical protein
MAKPIKQRDKEYYNELMLNITSNINETYELKMRHEDLKRQYKLCEKDIDDRTKKHKKKANFGMLEKQIKEMKDKYSEIMNERMYGPDGQEKLSYQKNYTQLNKEMKLNTQLKR